MKSSLANLPRQAMLLVYTQPFVAMQDFGYLRRDPDALYLNWKEGLR